MYVKYFINDIINNFRQDSQDIEQAKLEMGRIKNTLSASNSDSSRLHQKLNHCIASDKQHKEKIVALSQQVSDQAEQLRNADKQRVNYWIFKLKLF